MKLVSRLCLLFCLISSGVCWALPPLQWDFETPDSDWTTCALDKGSQKVALSTDRAAGGKSSLAITGTLPGGFGVSYVPWDDWTGYETLSFDLYVPKGTPKEFDVWVYLKDKQYYWYQTAPFRAANGKVLSSFKPGTWMKVKLDVSPTATIWKPGGHRKAWERTLYYPREFGVRFFSRSKWSGTVYLDNVQLTGNKPPLGKYQPGTPKLLAGKLKVTPTFPPPFREGAGGGTTSDGVPPVAPPKGGAGGTVPQYRKLELNFNPGRDYANPYDPAVVDVQGHFTAPDGAKINVPGFIYQSFERQKTPEGNEQLIPVGHSFWKVRFAPRSQGKYIYYVSVRDALGETRSDPASFVATAPVDPRGYVRVSKTDPRQFEFDNGQYFRPTGINMRDGGDQAAAQKGTFDFESYFKDFHDAGLNFVRTWMCAWWGGIEWSDKYHSRFDGVGRYSQYNAWRLDYAFELAEKNDLRLEITLNSHGQLRRDKFDAEWMYNPYNVRNGGFVASPAMFFSSKLAKEMVKQRYRYIVSRWGYSQNLMSWDMVNEVDLTEGYQRDTVAAWHQEMAAYLKSIDPWKHLVVTHICLYGYGEELFSLPEIDYVQADAYWDRRDVGMNKGWYTRRGHEKPFLFIEYGPQTVSLPISAEKWQQDFRVGMWVSNLIPSAAPGQFWYQDAWREHNLAQYQKGLLAFNAGEDRRGQNYQTQRAYIRAPGIPDWVPPRRGQEQGDKGPTLNVQAMGNGKQGCFYLFHFDNMLQPKPELVPEDKRVTGATVYLDGYEDGNYKIDFWDTLTGQVVGSTTAQAANTRLTLPVPTFAQDLAGKVKAQ